MNYINLFKDSVKKNGNKTAIVDFEGARSTSYDELDRMSGLVAGKLKECGAKSGDFVMINMGRKMEYLAAYIGIMKAGCVVIPTIPDYPEERIEFIKDDANCKIIIRDDFFEDIDNYEEFEAPLDEGSALLIYTSGSTGKPKGILHSVGDYYRSIIKHYCLYEGISPIIYAAACPLSFMAHIFETHIIFCMGGTVHLLSERIRKSPVEIADYYAKNNITMGTILPQLLKIYKNKSKTLQRVITCAERVSNIYYDDFEILNCYGMSETTGVASAFKLDKAYENTPVGKPIDLVDIIIVDKNEDIVPDGQEGEICFVGEFEETYYNDPELTSKIMIKRSDGNTLIHSGDIGYINENGDVVFINRKDWMVKINGQRVDTLEVETILNNMQEICSAVVIAFVDADGQTYLVAYYIPNDKVEIEDMREVLEAKLPSYMIPRFFVKMEEFPLNQNGKLNRLAFEAPIASEFKESYEAPTNDLEKAICAAFEKVLHCGVVGINDDFFALGGDSIKVLHLLNEIHNDDLTTNKILTGKTPKGIAKLCKQHGSIYISHSDAIPEISPLTDSQRGVYLECLDKPESTMYNIPMLCELPADIDIKKFISAIKSVAKKHPALNVTISAPNGEPSMIYKDVEFAVQEKSIKDLDKELTEFVKPFDLEKGPLYRFELIHHPNGIAFLFDIHHIVFDGTSTEAFVNQIADAYLGKECPAEKLSIFDIANAEASIKESSEYIAAQKFFEEKLGSVEFDSKPVPDQVLDKEITGAGTININADSKFSIATVEEFTKKHKISENTLFLAAFSYALAKYNGTNESAFCTVNNGRHDPRLDSSIGMFVRTMPLYYSFDEKQSVATLLPQIQEDFYNTMNNDCISFSDLAAQYSVTTDVTFIYQAELFNGAKIGKSAINVSPVPTGDSQTEIDVMLIKGKENFELIAHYKKMNYTEDFIKGFSNLILNVISGMLTVEKLSDIELLDVDDRKLLDSFNDTDVEYDEKTTLVHMFREQARKTPDNTCLVFKEKKFTYREVDELSDKLAMHLIANGVGKEKVVGILIPRSEYMLLCSLGVLKAGAAYMPLDPTYPAERLNLMMKDSGAMILISDRDLDHIIDDSFKGMRMRPDEIYSLQLLDIELPSPSPDDLFIMLYTSGSTGTPKGVMFNHSNSLVTVVWEKKYYELDEDSHVTSYASYGFDANVFDMYPPIISGGELHIIEEDIRLDFNALKNYFNENKITHTVMTTQVGRQFAEMPGLETLKHISVAGEKLTPPQVPNGFTMHNLYGPTESSVVTTWFKIKEKYRDVPIGKPVDNLKAYVVDKNSKPLPAGSVGELWISGPHVTRGYLNRPEKMAEAYGDNPFSKDAKYSRIYRTGDIVRFMHDGNLQFVGRRDGQVKIRGFRVELTEIEEVIRRFPAINDATVAAFDDKSGGKFIAAYVVSDEKIDTEALSEYIGEEKPPYMVPAVIMQIDKIPLNQNQKVNKRALPVPEKNIGEIVPPENETQQKIFDIVSSAIGTDDFGVTTDLYYAGLTSISSVKLNIELAEAFDITIKVADIKANSTVKKLEGFINSAKPQKTFEILDDYPITETQNGIFIESMSAPNTTVYNIPILIKLGKNVDLDKLETAINDTINAHPYVKSTLHTNDAGDVRAKRNDDAEVHVDIKEFDKLPELSSLIKPFNLLEDALYRIKIIKTKSDNYLLMDFHHIISDGTSEGIMLNDINRAYAGEKLEAETYSGYELALEEEELRSSETYTKAKEYWSKLLAGCETATLPKKNSYSNDSSPASVVINDNSSTVAIEDFCAKNGLTLNAFFNSVFSFVMKHFSGNDELSYATIYNGRNDSRLAKTVTMSVKTMPVALAIKDDIDILEFTREMQSQLMDNMANDICSFAELANDYAVNSDIIFAYQGEDFNFDTLCGEKFDLITIPLSGAKSPISLNIYKDGDNLRYVAEYRKDYFTEEFIAALVDSLIATAKSFIECKYLKQVSMLSDKAIAVYDKMNDTDAEFDKVYIHQLFEHQVDIRPDATAIVTSNGSINYKDLNCAANIIANELIARGVGKEEIVTVVLDRGVNIPLVELAVWKAGGAILPMLPSYPDDRISYCMENSESKFVITTNTIKGNRKELFDGEHNYNVFTVEELLKGTNINNPNLEIDPEQMAVCIYTSGSTGKPKGVMLEHHNYANFFPAHWADMEYFHDKNSNGAILAIASMTFDMSIFDIYLGLLAGHKTYITSEEEVHNPKLMRDVIVNNNVEGILATPSFINNLICIPGLEDSIKNLKFILIGAEAFPPALYTTMKEQNPNLVIYNGYGPTETTICSSFVELKNNEGITIGGPIKNAKYYVLDKFGNILPPYAIGELIICGELVARGYIKLPERNKASFFEFQGYPAYHSGDSVRLNSDGEIEFGGRMDNQVKLRGYRVELDEIENVMCSFASIKQAKVIVRNNGSEDFLAGYFTAEDEINLDELTAYMKSKLTYYMVPAAMMQLEQMPLTPNRKIDKKQLPEIKKESRKKDKRRAPKKSLEQRLCEIFQDVLGQDEIYTDDDFFELGGTSLTASKVTMILMSENITVEYGDIFSYPTPEKLAAYIEQRNGIATDTKTEGVSIDTSGQREALKYNQVKYAKDVNRESLGNILLTGATGFLGIHVLKELLDLEQGHIYALVRRGNHESPEVRLKNLLFYYFSDNFDEALKDRITLIEADITDEALGEQLKDIPFDTILNCAACVKHFTNSDILEKINVHGVENLIKVAEDKNVRLVQVSTVSIPGIHTDESFAKQIKMHENEIFVIDDMENKYAISKYHAELKILDAIENDGLRAKIVRVGNLMGRHTDGEFQANLETNMFLNGIRGFAVMGKYPISHMTDPMSFSPIDCTAKALVLLAGTNDKFTAFNANSRYSFDEMKVIDACNRNGISILPEDDEIYYAEFNKRLADDSINSKLTGLAAYDIKDAHAVDVDNLFTTNILYRIGFSWPLVDDAYLDRAINSILTLDYFNIEPEE